MERIHHCDRRGQLFGGGGFESGKPVHGNNFHAVAPVLRPVGQPLFECLFGTALNHVQQSRRARTFAYGRDVDDHGDVLVAAAGMTPDVLIDPDRAHPVEPGGVLDQHTAAFGQDRVVGGVPRHGQSLGNPRH